MNQKSKRPNQAPGRTEGRGKGRGFQDRPAGPDDHPGKEYVIGRKPVAELLAQDPSRVDLVLLKKGLQGRDVQAVLESCKANKVRYRFVDAETLARVHPGHQGMAAQVADVSFADLDALLEATRKAPLPVLCALDKVQDTGNVGSLARTLWGLGGGGLLVVQHGAAHLGAGAVKASAGCIIKLPVARVTNLTQGLEQCKKAGFTVYGLAKGADIDPRQVLDGIRDQDKFLLPAVLVLGNEDKGVRPGVLAACDFVVELPLGRELDSYNVSQAAALCLSGMARAAWEKGQGPVISSRGPAE